MKKNIQAITALCLLSFSAFGAGNYVYQNQEEFGYDSYSNYANSNLQGYALYVPAGARCKGILSQNLSSESAVSGQSVTVILKDEFIYEGKTIAPAGSVVQGSVANIQKASAGNGSTKMMVRFTTIVTPYGNTIPINAVIATTDLTGMLIAVAKKDTSNTHKQNTKTVTTAPSTGAVLGAAMEKMSKDTIHSANHTVTKNTTGKGNSIYIPANSIIELYFVQPITFTAE